jgi:CO/xanthine dehydrogenase FAD-binding subunit
MQEYKEYLTPKTISDALRMLSEASGHARLIAGGSDLLLDLRQGRHPPVDLLVDVNFIPDLQILEQQENFLFIGAAVPLKKVSSSPLVKKHAEALLEASGMVGGPQVRNSATLGGNVAHALPAGDGTIALHALGAKAEIASISGKRIVPIETLYKGPGRSALDPNNDLLIGFHIPLSKNHQASAFKRVMRPQGVALPIINMAAWLERDDNQIVDVRLAIGPAGPTPQRGIAAEDVLRGKEFATDLLVEAQKALFSSIHFRTSAQRASAEYRVHLCSILFDDVLTLAWQRALE